MNPNDPTPTERPEMDASPAASDQPPRPAPDGPWRADAFTDEDRVADAAALCERCGGTGLVREWSTILFFVAVVGFAGAALATYKAFTEPSARRMLGTLAFFLLCVGVFGAFPLIDKGDCKVCGGMGRVDAEEGDEETDDPYAEWAQTPPPE